MKYIRYVYITALLLSMNVSADQIELPHTFTSGTKAVASQVNENFSTLSNESNAQDSRISALESLQLTTVSDQLICVAYPLWPTSGSSYDCVQSSDPTNIMSLTYVEVAQDDWTVVSVGGDGATNRMVFVFSK